MLDWPQPDLKEKGARVRAYLDELSKSPKTRKRLRELDRLCAESDARIAQREEAERRTNE